MSKKSSDMSARAWFYNQSFHSHAPAPAPPAPVPPRDGDGGETTHCQQDPRDYTHYIGWDTANTARSPRSLLRARCGALIPQREHAPTPTCPTCQRIEAELAALGSNPFWDDADGA